MFKKLKTQEEKDYTSVVAILHTFENTPVPDTITIVQNFGITEVIIDSKGEDSRSGEHIVLSSRAEDVQNYLKQQKVIYIGIGSPFQEEFQILHPNT